MAKGLMEMVFGFHWHLKFYSTVPCPHLPPHLQSITYSSSQSITYSSSLGLSSHIQLNTTSSISVSTCIFSLSLSSSPLFLPYLSPSLSVYINVTTVLVLLFSYLHCSLRFFSKIKVWCGHSTALNPSMAPHCLDIKLELLDMVAYKPSMIWSCLPLQSIFSQHLAVPNL